jgi:hypothetical protein
MIDDAKRRHNAAATLLERGDLQGAESAFEELLATEGVAVEARYMLGLAILSQGRLSEGFRYYDSRWRISSLPLRRPLPFFQRWKGEDLTGKRLLVWPEQGLGDQIMFARLAFHLANSGVDVTMMAPESLVRLLTGRSAARIVSLSGSYELSGFDFCATDFELAAHMLACLADIPSAPYLYAAPRPHEGIGVMTSGNPKHVNDAERSLDAEAAAQLLSLPGAISLRPEDTGARDMQDTADVVSGLSLVVTVDTAVAHLAGAMGKRTLLLLSHHATDWRWMRGRSDTPWYPSVELVRQSSRGDWRSVLRQITDRYGFAERR